MQSIGQWLEENKQRVLDKWEERLRQKIPVTKPIDSTELTNSIPELYDDLVKTLIESKPKEYLKKVGVSLGKDHGEQRSRIRGYNLTFVIEEYQILRQVLLEVARERGELDSEDTDLILDTITIGIRNAASEFTKIKTDQLVRAKQDAEKASVAKSAFLANMSHEIRTPLGAILGYTELLKEAPSKSERDKYIQVINRNGKLLSKLIDDILDLSKIEAGHLEIEYIEFNLLDLLNEIITLFSERAKDKNIELIIEFPDDIPERICSDPTRIRQILINLVGNAIKFTSVGHVKVSVKVSTYISHKVTAIKSIYSKGNLSENPSMVLDFLIEDTGIGMNIDDSKSMFEPFSQIDSSMTRRFGGTGLGLSLSRKLARALGGDVWVKHCEINKGCTFVATVEAKAAGSLNPSIKPVETDLSKIKVLLVEDSIDNQFYIKQLLVEKDIEVDIASDGKEGVDKAMARFYDIIIMDVQMPILDGYQATRLLREKNYDRPIIALTAHAMSEDQKKSIAAGCDAHLTKPIDPDDLIRAISELYVRNNSRLTS